MRDGGSAVVVSDRHREIQAGMLRFSDVTSNEWRKMLSFEERLAVLRSAYDWQLDDVGEAGQSMSCLRCEVTSEMQVRRQRKHCSCQMCRNRTDVNADVNAERW